MDTFSLDLLKNTFGTPESAGSLKRSVLSLTWNGIATNQVYRNNAYESYP